MIDCPSVESLSRVRLKNIEIYDSSVENDKPNVLDEDGSRVYP